jgi:hypothetical protein
MASFTYNNYYWYNADDTLSPFGPTHAMTATGTITDGDADQTFTLTGPDGFTFNGSTGPTNFTSGSYPWDVEYVGYILDYNGAPAPVFLSNTYESYLNSSNGYYLVLSSEPSPSTPINVSWSTDLVRADFDTTLLCFHAGTRIATPSGATVVEDLRIGDDVLTSEGRSVPVKWIGRQTVSTRFGPAERLMPVRFAAGSLGEGLPHADLTVTADHGMLVDGVICHAGALVNGTTITRVPPEEMGETYTVYHVETEEHEIILANGAPAETFIDNVSRRVFDNFAEFETLYGDVPEMEELSYPRAMSARQVPARIAARLNGAVAA